MLNYKVIKLGNRLITIILLVYSAGVHPMWVKMDDCELIDKSALIVEAEFLETENLKQPANKRPIHFGILQISNVYKGSKKLATAKLAQPNPSRPISSVDIFYTRGQRGIWFLTTGKNTFDGIYYANTPQRYWPLEKKPFLTRLLENCVSRKQ